ncbi:MAG TPA: hypothetical protein VHL53_13970, partial [Acidimicrobiia bacterium]|nr:hypothetical protein [Acidimicrobiia bacterium]
AEQIGTDVIQVAEPWDSLLEHRDGPPPGGAVLASTTQNERFVLNAAQTSTGYATRRIPGALTTAPSPEVLEAAAAGGLAEKVGETTVAGLPCTQWTYKAPNENLALGGPDQKVEACITADGIPLREAITLQGRVVRVAEAVSVDRNPPVTPQTFGTDRDPSKDGAPGLLESDQLITEGARTGRDIVAVTAPEGFKVSRQVTVNRQAGENSAPVASYVQGFVSGGDLFATEQMLTPGAPAWSPDEGQAVDLGAKRQGKIVFRTGWAEVRLSVGGTYCRVIAPRPSVAVTVAKALSAKGKD